MPHPAPQGREPSGSDIHHPKTEPGLPNYCQHESRQLCRIQPHKGPSPREATYIILRRNQGSQITASTNRWNHAASRPTGVRAIGIAADIIPGRNQGSWITASTNPCNHAASSPTGARALGKYGSLPCSPSFIFYDKASMWLCYSIYKINVVIIWRFMLQTLRFK